MTVSFQPEFLSTLLQTEKESLERQLAGGYAHQLRNALAAAQLLTRALWEEHCGTAPASSVAAIVDQLEQLCRQAMDPRVVGDAATLLAAIRSYTAATERYIEEGSEVLPGIERALQRAVTVTEKASEYANLDNPDSPVPTIDLAMVLAPVLARVAKPARGSAVQVITSIAPAVYARIRAVHFVDLCTSLLDNAVDALAHESAGRLDVVLALSGTHVVLRVRDNGPGISAADLPRIYEPFFTTSPAARVGLGLCKVRRITELYDGTVHCKSVIGEGTEICVTFPMAPPPSSVNDRPAIGRPAEIEPPRIGVDDDRYCLASWRNFVIFIWRGERTMEGVSDIIPMLAEPVIERYGDNIALIAVFEEQAGVPTRKGQAEAIALEKRYGKYGRGAIIIEARGVVATTVRTIVTVVAALASRKNPRRFFSQVSQGCDWLAGDLAREGFAVDVEAFESVMAGLLRRGR